MNPPSIELITKDYVVNKAINNTRSFSMFHPSSFGGCMRKTAYQWYNETQKFFQKTSYDVNLKLERIFDNGHSMHHRWKEYFDGAGVLRGLWKCSNPCCGKVYGKETYLGVFNPLKTNSNWSCECGNNKHLEYEETVVTSPPEYNLRGSVDIILDLRNTKFEVEGGLNTFIVDMKSMKNDYFKDLEEAKGEHIIQVHIYMWLLDLQGAVVLYENKDNQAIKEIFVPKNLELIEQIKKQAYWLNNHVLPNNQLPQRPTGYTKSCDQCHWCEFSKICYQ